MYRKQLSKADIDDVFAEMEMPPGREPNKSTWLLWWNCRIGCITGSIPHRKLDREISAMESRIAYRGYTFDDVLLEPLFRASCRRRWTSAVA
ncbi:MAG: hypothetical protein CM1200mP2_42710 [Planctomycetaceae bacterium]|nr:MAG: hypothetical protein CM1200mP2_42710 [Planctomycetaceae bacterium]